MIIIKSKQEIELMREAGKVTALILSELNNIIKPGISTLEIDSFVVEHKGYMADAARTYPVGKISDEAKRLIETAEKAFFNGIQFAKEGYRLSDISHAVQKTVESEGFGVIRDFVGHGIGSEMHEEPQIPNYGRPGRGPRLQRGMTLAIEPMITQGSYEIDVLSDDWTAVTVDGKLAAHYENTVVITDGEPELLTL